MLILADHLTLRLLTGGSDLTHEVAFEGSGWCFKAEEVNRKPPTRTPIRFMESPKGARKLGIRLGIRSYFEWLHRNSAGFFIIFYFMKTASESGLFKKFQWLDMKEGIL